MFRSTSLVPENRAGGLYRRTAGMLMMGQFVLSAARSTLRLALADRNPAPDIMRSQRHSQPKGKGFGEGGLRIIGPPA